MSLSEKIREQIISSFRAEVVEHIDTLNEGLLTLEQNKLAGEAREEKLATIFRAAHSLKGAARAVGVSAIEQLAHALEDILGALQKSQLDPTPGLYTICYSAVDAISEVQKAYEEGKTAPPPATLRAMADLETLREAISGRSSAPAAPVTLPAVPVMETPPPAEPRKKTGKLDVEALRTALKNGNGHDDVEDPRPSTPEAVPAPPEASPPRSQTPGTPPPPPPTQPPVTVAQSPSSGGGAFDETIRVSVAKLDSLMAQLSELLVTKIHAEQRLAQVRQAQEYMMLWQKEWLAARSAYGRVTRHGLSSDDSSRQVKELSRLMDYLQTSQDRLRDMTNLLNSLTREYHSDTMQLSLVIDRLEEEVKRVRMLPLNTITTPFGRMVRDIGLASGKDIVLEIRGADVELDKRVLEQIKDPIIHLLRNAIDHGIESTEKRLAAGKPAQGTIVLSAEQLGKDVAISVSDDGGGIDIESIRQTAIRRNVPGAASFSDLELAELMYNPGFTTSPIITDVSGRGVGLDVVRRNVENLRGRISVEWNAGKGSRFTLILPLTLTSSRALLVRASGQLFAIPVNSIERIEYVRPDQIESMGGHDTIRYEDRPLMLVNLSDVLALPRPETRASDRIPVIILASAERQMAFAVDALADEQEVVIKGLGRQLTRVAGIAGASVMGSGEILLILNVADLMKLATRAERRSVLEMQAQEATEETASTQQRRILVVDDSITTRTLEKNILEAAGFIVVLATDGQEAFNLVMTSDLPDLVISDIQMPRMDGFTLAERLKKENRTAHLPIILVTSLDSPEDKARGIDVGADAYIVKSSFDQNNLLETIGQLI